MNKRFIKAFSLLIIALTSFSQVLTPTAHASPAQQALCTLTGVAFRDFNADAQQGANEPPVEGIRVQATNAAGTVVATALTGADGSYTLDVPDGVEVRIAFDNLPSFLRYGPDGAETSPGVTFETCTAASAPVNVGLANPGQHCDLNPDVVTSCYSLGDQLAGPNNGDDVLLSVPYTAGGLTGGFDTPVHTTLSVANEIGSVWGIAHQRQTDTLFAGAFQKRHAGYGPDGPGAIYQIPAGGGAPSLFTTLTAAPAGTLIHTDGTPYADRPAIEPWTIDAEAFDWVGKAGLGDATMSDDDSTLWVVNLFDRRLYSIAASNPGSVSSFAIPQTPPGCPAGNGRPFAVEFYDGQVYVGVTCSAESSQNVSDLRAYVYRFNPASPGFNLVLNVPLNYDRGCLNLASDPACSTIYPAEWRPWVSAFPSASFINNTVSYPQPWLSDIEFDNNGDLILAIRDRFGDQIGNQAPSPVIGDLNLYLGITAGDILRACATGPTSWALEANGSCGGITTGGAANTGQGPGVPGGEFYFEDNLETRHEEVASGSLLQVPGQGDVIGTVFDPIPIDTPGNLFDAGFRWLDNTTGTITRAYRVYNGVFGAPDVFGKANGLGGMEALCPPAPIEIGNRVWLDLDNDGVQDPGETPVAGVTVSLYDAAGNQIAQTVTNGAGEYLFTSLQDGVAFNTDYVVRLDNPADFAAGGPLFEWFLTNANTGANNIDSDAVLVGTFPTIELTTGDPGDNNHTYDFGFVVEPPPPTTTPPSTDPPGDPGDSDGDPSIVIAQASGPISIIKSANPPFAQIGDTVIWTIRVTNNTDSPVADVTITDTIPNGMSIISVTSTAGNPSVSGQNISLTLASLGPGDQVVVTITTRINAGSNVPLIFTNAAYVNGELFASAQVVRASQLVQTGEPPWWRDPLIASTLALLIGSMSYGLLKRRHLTQS